MQLIAFTKLLKPWGAKELIAFAQRTGLAGYDLTVRDGYPVTPARISTDLVPFVKQLKDAGLSVPMATVGVRALMPGEAETEQAWAACAEAGIGKIKLGYWTWEPDSPHYWDRVKTIKQELQAYAKLSEKYGVQSLFHTHSDPYYGLNASALMHLLDDVDPQHVGAYIDPAHLSVDGEPLAMALDILKGRLAMVAVKNMRYTPKQDGDTQVWRRGTCPLAEGLVDWRKAIAALRSVGYDGALSMHAEYEGLHDTEPVVKLLEPDIAYLSNIVKNAAV